MTGVQTCALPICLGLPPNVEIQRHARKSHSDYWVFEKPKRSWTYPKEGGVKLSAGIDPTEVAKTAKELAKGAADFAKYLDDSEIFKSFKIGRAHV